MAEHGNDFEISVADANEASAFKICWEKRSYYAWSCSFAIIFACFVCLCIPSEYAAKIELSDEHRISMDLSIGLSRMDMLTRQAQMYEEGMKDPEVYTQLLKSSTFLGEFLNTKVEKYGTTYYEYLLHNNKLPWWSDLFTSKDSSYVLSLLDDKIRYKLSIKYTTITLQVKDNDPEVAAVMVDSLRVLLAKKLYDDWMFTNKVGLEKTKLQRKEAGIAYHAAADAYSRYAQANGESELGGVVKKLAYLQKEKDDAFLTYNEACLKYNRYVFLMQRQVPYFTVLSRPTIPQSPCAPVWVAYVLAYSFIAFVLTTWFILYRNMSNIKRKNEEE